MTSPTPAGVQRRRSRASRFGETPDPQLPSRARRAAPGPSDDLVQAFVVRSSRALARIAERMPRERLLEAVGASTDTDVLFHSLQDAAAIGSEITPDAPDPLTAALLRGSEMKRDMLKAEGGALSGPQLAAHLGVTPQGLGRKRERNQVFWLEVGDGFVFPAFQIGETGLLPGVREVLAAFQIDDPWMRVHFMLSGERRLGGRRPIEVLREGQIEPVVQAASAYGEHGAA
jgi:hypothetical protein